MRYILASRSPRRRDLIGLTGLAWQFQAADIDEDSIHHPDPAIDVMQTAWYKAKAVASTVSEAAIIVGADTTVILGNDKLDKPEDAEEARTMLRRLRGRTHHVHTGIAAIRMPEQRKVLDVATMAVPMRVYSDTELEAYVDSGDPLDKAGAYAIQHAGFRPATQFHDCFAGVIGLPLCHLTRSLRALELSLPVSIAAACQHSLAYHCPVFADVLDGSPRQRRATTARGSDLIGPASDLA